MNCTDINNGTMEMANLQISESIKTITAPKQWHWVDFPIELWEIILSYLDLKSAHSLIQSSESEYMRHILTNFIKNQINYYKKDISRMPLDCYNAIMKMDKKKVDILEACSIFVQWKLLSIFDSIEVEEIKYINENEKNIPLKLIKVDVSGRWLIINASSKILSGYRLIHLDTNEAYSINTHNVLEDFNLVRFDFTEDNTDRVKTCTNNDCLCLGDMAHQYICEVNFSTRIHSQCTYRKLHIDYPEENMFDFRSPPTGEEFIMWQYKLSPLFHHGKPPITSVYKAHFEIERSFKIFDISVMRRDDILLIVLVLHNPRNDDFRVNFYENKNTGEQINHRSYDTLPHQKFIQHWPFNGSIAFGVTLRNELFIFTKDHKINHIMNSIYITSVLLRMNLLILGTTFGEVKIYKLNNVNELFNKDFNWLKPNYSCFVNKETFKPILQIVPVEWSKYLDIIVRTGDKHIYRLKMNYQEIML